MILSLTKIYQQKLLKMKNKKLNSSIHAQIKFQVETINKIRRGIAMRFLQKYRPKCYWDIENMSNSKKYNIVASSL